jgi:hypothetical protein
MKIFTMGGAIAAGLLMGHLCGAANEWGYGTSCEPVSGSATYTKTSGGMLSNLASTADDYVCGYESALCDSNNCHPYVVVVDLNLNEDVQCLLNRMNSSGQVTWTSTMVPSSSWGGVPQTLSFPVPAGSGHFWEIWCELPAQGGTAISSIVRYSSN